MKESISRDTPIAMALRVAYLTMHREADAVLKPHGLSANQFVMLWELHTGGEMTQISLAQRIASDRNTIRPMITSLEKKRLVCIFKEFKFILRIKKFAGIQLN